MSALMRPSSWSLRVPDIGHAAAHAGGEVVADGAEQDGDAAGHVLAAVVAAALDHGDRTGVADGEALAGAAGGEELAGGGAVEAGVADDGVVGPDDRRGGQRADDDGAAGEALADIVVGVAEHLELEALDGEGAERLAGRAAQADGEVAGGELVHAVAAGDLGRDPGADGAVDVPDIVGELHLLAVLEHGPGVLDHAGVERVGDLVAPGDRAGAAVLAGVDLGQERVEVEIVEVGVAAADLAQEIGAADGLLQRAQAQGRQDLAHLLGDEAHQVDDLLGPAGEALAQVGALGADADRAGVGVALADQDAAHGDQGQGADAVLLGPQQGGDDHVAAGLDAAVGAQGDAVAQAVEGQDLVDLGRGPSPRACRHI